MKVRSLISLLLALVCLPLAAQQMSLEDFTRLKGRKVEKDKTQALLDLVTDETGFTVLGNRNQPVEVVEGAGLITLKVPHRTTHLTIRHPAYGQLNWQAPQPLKRRRHYRAQLFASDPTREYKATHQWALFRLHPADMLLQIDSLPRPVRAAEMEYYLPLGSHTYRAEAPFFEPVEGRFTLTDSARAEVSVQLQPFYSYLTVKTPGQEGELYIDGSRINKEEATSYRLDQGYHRVNLFKGKECFYDTLLFLGRGQKKVLEVTRAHLRKMSLAPVQPADSAAAAVLVPVKVSCKDPAADILVDRECVGQGSWEGTLPLGFHLLGARKNGQEGEQVRLVLEDSFPQEITLPALGAGSGLVNIHCNVREARILVDGEDRGTAPQLLQLNAAHTYEITLYKAGYRDRKCRVRPRAQGQTDVYMKLKKR